MPTPEEIKAAEEAAAKATEEAKAKEAEEARLAGITTDAGKEALRKEREAKRAAEKIAKEASDELAALKAEKATADAAKAKADEAEALKRGEHETVIAAKTTENETLKSEREALAAKVKSYEARDSKRIEDGLSAIPDDLKAFDPGKDAPLDQRLAWFEKAAQLANERKPGTIARTPGTPNPDQTSREKVVEDEKRRQRARYGLRPR